ncbi:DUF6338 family protein [Amycolatopsis thermalba]|uniref:DUF6338 family protein n=1 Tax=Amycolatopsis thermalba TaxID=944492 RepID=A0ABY4NYR4_9PSEU|nr:MULTISPECIES: DUF6338 family protein [Amycolatopsis]UQS25191.1 DUF6338 family protein [Amycolatopsis thermalba]
MQAPSTVVQLALLVLLVLPGITYQFVRERRRGPVPGERDLGERVLRAIVASIALDAAYAIVAGPALVRLARGTGPGDWTGFTEQPRLVGAVAVLLFLVVPALAAGAVSLVERRRRGSRYLRTPTAWDHAFRDREPCFVRVRLKDGNWAGGWYGHRSYASSYPHPPELYLESARVMGPDGSFGARVHGTAGLRLRAEDFDVLEFVEPDQGKEK